MKRKRLSTNKRRACTGMSVAGVPQPHERFEVFALPFGHDMPAVVMPEAISHHAIEAGERPELFGRRFEQRLDRALTLDAFERALRDLHGISRASRRASG